MTTLRAVCESGRFSLGPAVETFEERWAAHCGLSHCVALNSGTSALHLALLGLDVGPGDEVITVPMTFISTVWAITYVGAKPVFVDIDPATRMLDPAWLEDAITPRTRAILPVHLYGFPADMGPILEVADRHGIPVVEDASQAQGARYDGRHVGGLGRVGCFSFYPSKNLGAYGEGGALVTDDDDIAQRTRALRNHGQRRRDDHVEIGSNYRMDAFQGAVLSVKLGRLDDWVDARAGRAARYLDRLRGLPLVLPTPPAAPGTRSAWHLFVIETNARDTMRETLAAAGIDTGMHYPRPVHLQPAYAHLGHEEGDFPASERLARRCLSLPIYPQLRDADIDRICAAISSATAE
jgi:dTDP-4-amino-4,6-dideoxygalactose transaminase